MTKITIGLIGEGSIAEEYLETIASLQQFQLAGYHGSIHASILSELNTTYYDDQETLMDSCDAVLIVMPPAQQFEIAKKALKKLKHIFIEKPLTTNLEKTETLISMQREANVKIQVSSGIRSNKEFIAINSKALKPLYIETQHFSNASNEGELPSVTLNLMLEDIDIVLALVRSDAQKISAVGVCVENDTPDIVNARIEFANGCVATLTAGRTTKVDMHSANLFLKDNSLLLDFLDMESPDHPYSTIKSATQRQATDMVLKHHNKKGTDAITTELTSFYHSITKNITPPTTLYDSFKALKLANMIIERLEERGLEG